MSPEKELPNVAKGATSRIVIEIREKESSSSGGAVIAGDWPYVYVPIKMLSASSNPTEAMSRCL